MPDSDADALRNDEVDRAIADYLRQGTEPSLRRLLALGPPALRRAVEFWYGGVPVPKVSRVVAEALPSGRDRENLDKCRGMMAGLARANPETYLEEIDAGRVRISRSDATLEIGILGSIDLPGAVALLCRYRTHRDWLVRRLVIDGLGWRTDPAAIEAVEAAVTDEERMIRDEAARWVQRRDPDAAHVLYQRLLADPGLQPELRPELVQRLSTAKRLATIRHRRTHGGLVLSVNPDGHVLATGRSSAALFPGQSQRQILAAYTSAYGGVEAVFAPRWRGYIGVNLTADELSDLVQCIVLHWLYFYNINYRDLKVQFWLPPTNDLDHPQTYRIVQNMVFRRLKRGRPGHDQLCSALLDIPVAEYRRWAIGNDRFMDR